MSLLHNVSKETLLVAFHIPCQIRFRLHLGFTESIPAHPNSTSIFFPGQPFLISAYTFPFYPSLWLEEALQVLH